MLFDFKLKNLPAPRIESFQLSIARQKLQEITALNLKKSAFGSSSAVFTSQREELIRRLKLRSKREKFEDIAGSGRERLLLNIYLEYASDANATWLPKFDTTIAQVLLGGDVEEWHAARRRDITLLFFMHFDRLPAIGLLCKMLTDAYAVANVNSSQQSEIWHKYRDVIFALDGPERVARAAQKGEKITALMERFAIPADGKATSSCFSLRLKESYLLRNLELSEIGHGREVLEEIKRARESPYQAGLLLGAAALKVMTQKVLKSGGSWGAWADWMLELGCDPNRIRSDQFPIWWGAWHPTRAELECAQRGLRSRTLEYFIKALEDSLRETDKYDQFESRARFIRWLDATDKIEDFKLILTSVHFQSLPKVHRTENTSIKKFANTNRYGASIIVLKCTDSVWISEGTHSYAIRVFRNTLPIRDVFSENRNFTYAEFISGTMHKDICEKMGIWETHLGDWVNRLIRKIRYKHNVEWYLHNY